MRLEKIAVVVGLVLWSAPLSLLRAQTATAVVNGTVLDPSGASVPGTLIELTSQDTNITDKINTNSAGNYTFLNLLPGHYVLTAEKTGFKKVALAPFTLQVDQTLTENITLEMGAANQTVEVSAASEEELIQRSSSELGTVIDQQDIINLPLNGRNFTQLLILTPGITPISTAQGSGVGSQDAGISAIPSTGSLFYKPAVNGQENRENLFYLDGIENTDIRGAVYGFLPIIDTVQEFKVQSQNGSAEYGGTLGGVVNVVSKSGTNTFHGSAWEFDRNNIFDARNPFTDFCNSVARCPGFDSPGGPTSHTPASPGHYTQNEFGAAVGGPIFKNNTFFYAGYEGWRFSAPSNTFENVPTQAELGLLPIDNGNADFTGSLQGIFSSTSQVANQIFNPYSPGGGTRFQCVPGTGSGNPFTSPATYVPMTPEPVNTTPGASFGQQPTGTGCNIIPAALVNPQMVQLIQAYFSKPNFSPVFGVQNSNFLDSRAHTDNNNEWQVRIDHTFNDHDTVFGRLSQMWVADSAPIAGTISSIPSDYHGYDFGGGWDHIFRSNLILDVRAGAMLKPYTFYQNAGLPPGGDAPEVKAGFTNQGATQGFFMTGIDGITIGSQAANLRGNPVANADGSLTWIKGPHTVKFGMQYTYTNRYQQNNFTEVDYSANQTTPSLNKSVNGEGNSLASALLVLPTSFSVQTPANALVYLKMPTWAGYVQDEWHVRPSITLSLGLRYDFIPQASIIGPSGRPLNAVDLFTQQWIIGEASVPACPAAPAFTNPCIPGGFSSSNPNFTVKNPLSNQTFNTFNNIVFDRGPVAAKRITDNWGPRAGVAWQFLPNTVLRAGLGLYYDTITARSQWVQNTELGADWPWTEGSSSLSFNQGNAAGGSTALSPMLGLLNAGVTPSVATTPWGLNQNGGFLNDPDYVDARSLQWHADVEHQFGANMKLSVAYVGSRSDRLDWTGKANAAQIASPVLTACAPGTTAVVGCPGGFQTSPQGVTSCGPTPPNPIPAAYTTCTQTYYTNVDKLRLMPFGRSDYPYSTSTGYANYNALQVEFQRRFSRGLTAIASYTWSKCLGVSSGWFDVENGTNGGTVPENWFNKSLSYGPCGFDVPQDFTLSGVYALPFGRGQSHLAHGPLSWILGNWETNLFFIARSGQNYEISNGGGDPAGISGSGGIGQTSATSYDRPDVVPGQSLKPATQDAAQWFNPGAFCIIPTVFAPGPPVQPAPVTAGSPSCTTTFPMGNYPVFGNFGVGVLRDQFFYDTDFSLLKNFYVTESKYFQFRVESYNIFNLQILGTPSATLGTGTPGSINSISSNPREFQLGAKFVF